MPTDYNSMFIDLLNQLMGTPGNSDLSSFGYDGRGGFTAKFHSAMKNAMAPQAGMGQEGLVGPGLSQPVPQTAMEKSPYYAPLKVEHPTEGAVQLTAQQSAQATPTEQPSQKKTLWQKLTTYNPGLQRLLGEVAAAYMPGDTRIADAAIKMAAGEQYKRMSEGTPMSKLESFGITPEERQAVTQQQLDQQRTGAYVKQADASIGQAKANLLSSLKASTPQERKELASMGGTEKNQRIVELGMAPEGVSLQPGQGYMWAVDSEGNPTNPVGLAVAPRPLQGTDPKSKDFQALNYAAGQASKAVVNAGYGELVMNSEGQPYIKWNKDVMTDEGKKTEAMELFNRIRSRELENLLKSGLVSSQTYGAYTNTPKW